MQNSLKNTDSYLVYNDYFSLDFTRELNLLYLPLINNNAVSLYQFLSSKILKDNNLSIEYNHFDIIDNLGIDIKAILLSRKKLEAFGLLETRYLEREGKTYYIYILKRPLTFNDFFENPLLNKLLENTIGTDSYNQIKAKYNYNKLTFNNFKNISAKFSDLYNYENIDSYDLESLKNQTVGGPNLDSYYFDVDKLKYLLTGKYMEDILDNTKIKEDIISIAHLYKATPFEMLSGLEQSVDMSLEEYELNIDKLQDYFVQLHTIVKKQNLPTTENMLNKKMLKELYEEDKVLTAEEQYAKKLDALNYIDFLKEKYNIIVSNVDSKNIVTLVTKYNLTPGVLNILLDYGITETKQGTIPHFNYLDKVASAWTTKRLISALDAMKFVKNQRDNNKKNQTIKVKKDKNIANNTKRVVNSPDYIRDQVETLSGKKKIRVQTEEDIAAHNDLMQLLREKGID